MTSSDSRLCIAGPHRLAWRFTGLAVQRFVTPDSVQAMRPRQLKPEGINAWCDPTGNDAAARLNPKVAQRNTAPAHTSVPNPSPHSNAAA